VIKVVDQQGAVIPDAIVTVDCTEDPDSVRNGLTLTDARGLTPAGTDAGAVLITKRKLQATDDPEKPRESNFAYCVSIYKRRYQTKRVLVKGAEQIPRPWVVELGKRNVGDL
jgi:hypothetical protein